MEQVGAKHRQDHGMINRLTTILLCLTLATTGCQSSWRKQDMQAARVTEPPLAADMTCVELVDFLNRQNKDLQGWRSSSTRMEVRVPNFPRQKLNNAAIACQSPNYFRLTASGLIATADLGSNNQRCWAYVKPGEPAVLTWRHEDTPLLQHIPTGVPYIDPNWLMLVLGVTPLDANEYRMNSSGSILEMAAIEDAPSGRPMRRVIRVDRTRRVVREHAIYDSEGHKLVSAVLGNHRWVNNKLMAHSVTLDFPQMQSEIKLTFKDIETNPHLPDTLWHLPDHELQVVDLGDMIRNNMLADSAQQPAPAFNDQSQSPRIQLQAPSFDDQYPKSAAVQSESQFYGSESEPNPFATEEVPEPEWSTTPISHARTIDTAAPAAKPKRRGFFGRFGL